MICLAEVADISGCLHHLLTFFISSSLSCLYDTFCVCWVDEVGFLYKVFNLLTIPYHFNFTMLSILIFPVCVLSVRILL
jgi:hypothetical protein